MTSAALSSYAYEGAGYSARLEANGWHIKASQCLAFRKPDVRVAIVTLIKAKTGKNIDSSDIFASEVEFKNVKIMVGLEHQLQRFSVPFEEVKQCLAPEYRDELDLTMLRETLKTRGIDLEVIELSNQLYKPFFGFHSSKSIRSLPAFRGFPQRVYNSGGSPNPLAALLEVAERNIKYRMDLETKEVMTAPFQAALRYWACEYFNLADDLDIKEFVEGYSSEILLKHRNKWIPINNVGFGVSQILPIIFKTLLTSSEDTLIIDEAEIHLHPSLQAKLAAFFLQMAAIGKKVVLETHSDHLVGSLVYLLANHSGQREKVKLHWVSMTDEGAMTEEIVYDNLGYIINTPSGFMDEQRFIAERMASMRLRKLDENG